MNVWSLRALFASGRRRHCATWSAVALLALAGCASSPPQASLSALEQPFDEAAVAAADALVVQLRHSRGRAQVVVDPMIDAGSGQRTAATQRLQTLVQDRLAAQQPTVAVLPFAPTALAQASHVLTGTLQRSTRGDGGAPVQLRLALTRLADGVVAAQAQTLARGAGLDMTPLPAEQDSPVLVLDRALDGYVRTSQTPPGQSADPGYLRSLPVAPLVQAAIAHYEAGRYPEALSQYGEAAGRPGGDQMRVLSGMYLSAARLGQDEAARAAFRRIVDHGLANRQLGVKFLFNPGGTDFWGDPKISGAYGMWLDELAQGGQRSQLCLDVVGHTSRTGTPEFNDALSQRRADVLRDRLVAAAPALRERLRTQGRGWRDNIIGTGTDNIVDALDRRVEFRAGDCKR